ncbi:MAG: DUF342 domain-containing protein [Burkholderiales bacterium]|nr:DUF342 domain-containing protein [Burkholderiales bacterium]
MSDVAEFSVFENTESRKLFARFVVAEGATPPNVQLLRQMLMEQGLTGCSIDDQAINAFLGRCKDAVSATEPVEPIETVIGERRDGSMSILVSPSRMSATLTLIPPQGGKAVSAAEVNDAISARGIVHGLNTAGLTKALETGACDGMVLAEGTEPVPGVPPRFESLIESLKDHGEDEDETVDYRDLGDLLLVEAGTPLVRRIPAVPGQDGMDVMGKVVPVKPVPDRGFAKGLQGVKVDEGDANLLSAAIAGQPKVIEDGANVNPVVDVANVDLESGNINFDGTIQVKGDIKAGMSVRVAGDVIVHGTVESAEIVCGGNVSVKGGIVGRADGVSESDETARISCNGSVQARFVEHARIEAGQSIAIDTAARQSELMAGNEITVGKSASAGQIIGGQVRALQRIRAAIVGSNANAPTVVQVGFDPRVNAERLHVEQFRKRKLEEFARVRQLLAFLAQNPAKAQPGVKEKAINTGQQIEAEIAECDLRLVRLTEQLELADGASIEISKTIYGGVVILIGQKRMEILDERRGGKIRLVEDHILIT